VYKVENLKADVLVIGSRGMGAMKRAFVGSVSDYCVNHCHTAVIVPLK
jgi:nucleotide-binding universal stress UspA family protein